MPTPTVVYLAEYAFGESAAMWQAVCATENVAYMKAAEYALEVPWARKIFAGDLKAATAAFREGQYQTVLTLSGLKGLRVRSLRVQE